VWTRIAVHGGFGYLFAANGDTGAWRQTMREAGRAGAEWLEYADDTRGIYRACTLQDGRLDLCLFAGPAAAMPDLDHLKCCLPRPHWTISSGAIFSRAGQRSGGGHRTRFLCACFGVGNQHDPRGDCLARRRPQSKKSAKALRAGTNCGSCIPEMKKAAGADRA
jgi:assimilatory nitrate reductase catalytic subunit